MFIPAQDCHHRSAIKAVSWRALGSLDTFVLSYFITGSFVFAGSIASAETVTKVVLYYLHERAWSSLSWGQSPLQIAQRPAWTRIRTACITARRAAVAATSPFVRPRELVALAAFLVCFSAVVSPPHFGRPRPAPQSLNELAPGPVALGTPLGPDRATAIAERQLIEPIKPDESKIDDRVDVRLETVARSRDEESEHLKASLVVTAEEAPLPSIRVRDLSRADQAEEVQQKLAGLGYFSGPAIGVWGPRSRDALRAFKEAHELGSDENWDEHTESVLFDAAARPGGISLGSGQPMRWRALRLQIGGASFLLSSV
jgi:uncharacterized membrane protein